MDDPRQAFVPGRHASQVDCGIDTLRAAVAMLLVYTSSAFLKKGGGYRANEKRTARVR